MGVDGNEVADPRLLQSTRRHKPALGRSAKAARGVIRYWMSRKHEEHLLSIHGKGKLSALLKDPQVRNWGELLKLS